MGPILILAGSIRIERRSFGVAEYELARLQAQAADAELLDPRDYPLPLFDGATTNALSQEFSQRCLDASGFVFVVPEWHAGVPGTFKNMLDYLGSDHFAGKPVGLVSVSSALGGPTVLSHLRDTLGVLGAVLVGPFIPVRQVKTAFDEIPGSLSDPRQEAQLVRALATIVRIRSSTAAAART